MAKAAPRWDNLDETALSRPGEAVLRDAATLRDLADHETAVDLFPEAGEAVLSDVDHPGSSGPHKCVALAARRVTAADDEAVIAYAVCRAIGPAESAEIDHA